MTEINTSNTTTETEEIVRLDKTGEVSTTTTDLKSWDTSYNIVKRDSKENKFAKEFVRQWAWIEFVVAWFINTATKATRSINTRDDWIIEVPDDWLRYKALRDIAKIEWAFENLWWQEQEFDWDVIFID